MVVDRVCVDIRLVSNHYHLSTLFLGMTSVFDEPKATDEAREEVKQNRIVKKFVRMVQAVKRACPGFR